MGLVGICALYIYNSFTLLTKYAHSCREYVCMMQVNEWMLYNFVKKGCFILLCFACKKSNVVLIFLLMSPL